MSLFNILLLILAIVFLGASGVFFRMTYQDFAIKGEFQQPSAPVYYTLCFLVSFGLWNWVNFGAYWQSAEFGSGIYLLYLMATAFFIIRSHRYDLFIPHVIVILGIGVMHLTHAIQETKEITVDNFSYKMMDYVEALQSEDPGQIEKVLNKYRGKKIPIAAVLQFLPTGAKKSYLLLVKRGVLNDSHEFERFLIHVYKKDNPEDQEALEAYAQAMLSMSEAMRRDFLFFLIYTPSEVGSAQKLAFLQKLSDSGLKPEQFRMHAESYLLFDLANEIAILTDNDLKEHLDFLKLILPMKEKFLPASEIGGFEALLNQKVHELEARSVK